jgi:transposase InsO family protein
MKERVQFVLEWQKRQQSMSALCRAFGISRQTGYKWVGRFLEEGEGLHVEVLQDLSRAPHRRPNALDEELVDLLVRARKLRPNWGPRKLKAWLEEKFPELELPAPSTIGGVLQRHGLVSKRLRRRRTPPWTQPFSECTEANALWCVDFKGHFRLGDGTRCYPLTVMDAHSRYLIRCEGLIEPDGKAVLPVFESAFSEYGLPAAIRTDNGPPFASIGPGGLTELSVWWIKLGILPERIEPGKPQQNGRHERMHLTLKQETALPPRATARAQQRAFDLFRRVYNEERPHEALGQKPPATFYERSGTEMPDFAHRRAASILVDSMQVDRAGDVRWGRGKIHVGTCLFCEYVEFHPAGLRSWELRYGPIVLGLYDETRRERGLIRPKRRTIDLSVMSPV